MRFSFRNLPGPALALACAVVLHGGAPTPALAANPIVLAQDDPSQPPDDPASAAALLVRVDRLENKLRTLTGQIEELQFQNKRLEDALRKMQQDVDFRFQDLGRGATPPGGKPPLQKRSGLDGVVSPDDVAEAAPPASPAAPPAAPAVDAAKPQRRGDAFDPAADPSAPGAPKPLGTTPPSAPLRSTLSASATPPLPGRPPEAQPHAPLDLLHGPAAPASPPPGAPADDLASLDAGARPAAGGDAGAGGAGGARGEYETGYAAYKSGQYDAAASSLQAFIQKYPSDRLIPDATYFLGESYARLGRQREAAEQFLKMSTDYNRSTRAPDALLRLGVALNALGAKDQACATYQEVGRKYPSASPDVRAGVERELKRARC